jgi:hypothetical protein
MKVEQIIASPSTECASGSTTPVTITAKEAGYVHLGRLCAFGVPFGAGATETFQAATDPRTGHRFPACITSIDIKGREVIKSTSGAMPLGCFWPWRPVQNRVRVPGVFLGSGETITFEVEVPSIAPAMAVSFAAPFSPNAGSCDLLPSLSAGGIVEGNIVVGSATITTGNTGTVSLIPNVDGIIDLSRVTIQAIPAATPADAAGQLAQQELDVSELMLVSSFKEQGGDQLLKGSNGPDSPNLWAPSASALWVNLGQQAISPNNSVDINVVNPLLQTVAVCVSAPLLPSTPNGQYDPKKCF